MSSFPPSLTSLQQVLIDAAEQLYQTSERLPQPLYLAAQAIVNSLTCGGKVVCAGQGPDAWLAQQTAHLLVHGQGRLRPPLAALDVSFNCQPSTQALAGSLSSRVMALGQAGDIWLAFSLSAPNEEMVQATQAAKDLDLILLIVSSEADTAWADRIRDTDMWLALPGTHSTALFGSAWLALHGLCEAVDSHLLGEEL
jgi:D-sedoheptulose 7-phosphate isomerase